MWDNVSAGGGLVSILGVFLYGCAVSMHCIGMCGGIILSVTVCEKEEKRLLWKKQAAYHSGRLLTGLLWGIFLGFAGEIFVMNHYFKFLFPVACGLVMIYLGAVHLGVMDKIGVPGVQSFFGRLYGKVQKKGTLAAGMLTGLLPCGMLNTIQVYAAGTGSVPEAVMTMLAFVAGTIPVLWLFGTLHGALTKAAGRIAMQASGLLTIFLGGRLIWKGIQMF